MSRTLNRRSAGMWLGVVVAVAAWAVAGPVMTIGAFAVAASFALAEHLLRLWRPRHRRTRPVRLDLVNISVAGISWALAGAADFAAPAARAIRVARELHPLGGASAIALTHTHITGPWDGLIDLLVGGALVSSLLVARTLRRPEPLRDEGSPGGLDRARWIVDEHGEDSLSSFILRPDKSFQFADDAVVAYRVVGETVVISGDPVGPDGAAVAALGRLVRRAHESGLQVVAYGASRAPSAGGPSPRPARDSRRGGGGRRSACVHARGPFGAQAAPVGASSAAARVADHVREGREIDRGLEAEIDAVESVSGGHSATGCSGSR